MRRLRGGAVVALAAMLLAACGSAGTTSAPTAGDGSPSASASTGFDPSASSEVYLPTATPAAGAHVPLVVLVPGGGWDTSDRSGLVPLAQSLADTGAMVVNTTYRAGEVGAHFPVPLQDVRCDAAYAVAQAKARGLDPGPVVLVGHSAGGHLAALAAVSGTTLAAPCPDPVQRIDGLVGLAGVYDTAGFAGYMIDFFGAQRTDDPALWDSGDPIHYVATGAVTTPLHVLLVHGTADDTVPLEQSRAFAAALRAARIPVVLDEVPRATHMSLIEPAVVRDRIATWLRAFATPTATPSS